MTYHRIRPVVVVVNQSTILSDADVADAVTALQRQVTQHFAPEWNMAATLWSWSKDNPIPDEAWALIISDDSDQAGALGYHETTHSNQPIGFVFAKTDRDYQLSWTVTASHELLEMLGDPYANICAQIGASTFVAYETADAVEADGDGYALPSASGRSVLVSDFVLPAWFVPGAPGPYDFRDLCKKPLELRPGGYIGQWTPKTGWTQETNGEPRHRGGPRFRKRVDMPHQGPLVRA